MSEMKKNDTKYCEKCGQLIDIDCVVCPKCGKQIKELNYNKDQSQNIPFVINNNASSSSSASASASAINSTGNGKGNKRLPWYLTVIGMIFIAIFTCGISLFITIPMRLIWDFSK